MPLNVEPQDFGRKLHERREAFRSARSLSELSAAIVAITDILDLLGLGVVGYVERTTDFTPFTTTTDVTDVSLSFTASDSRLYKISWFTPQPFSSVGTDTIRCFVTDGSNNVLELAQAGNVGTGTTLATSIHGSVVRDDLDGAVTVKMRASRVGTGNGTLTSTAAQPTWLLVEDIGPNSEAFFLLLEGGDFLLLEDGTSFFELE